jgi:hypothetical protein
VPRTDRAIRERVLDRYGREGAERLRTGQRTGPPADSEPASG